MFDLISPALAAIATLFAAFLAYRGSKDSDSTDRLSKAADIFGNYADRLEKRISAVESTNEKLQNDNVLLNDAQAEVEARLNEAEKQAEIYKREARSYKKLIMEVIQWITELLDWEVRDYKDPAPLMTLNVILSHLTDSIKDQNIQNFEKDSDSDKDRL